MEPSRPSAQHREPVMRLALPNCLWIEGYLPPGCRISFEGIRAGLYGQPTHSATAFRLGLSLWMGV